MSRMVIVYIDSQSKARHTGISVSLETSMATWLAFTSYKQIAVQMKGGPNQLRTNYYVIGYYNNANVLFDHIGVDAEGFEKITKQKALTEAEWLETDALIREAMQRGKNVP